MGKRLLMGIMAALFSVSFALPASAQVTLDDVLKRVEALEKENSMLKEQVMALKNAPAPAAAVASAPASGNFLKTGPEISLYGQIKTDLAYSDSNESSVSTSNTTIANNYAMRETIDKNQGSFNGSAQDTRLGLNFKAPDLDNGGKVTGKVEMDFAGGQPSSTYTPRLRLGYAVLDFDKWSVTAGQTWDFFSPLNTNVLSLGALNRQGNLGTRRPQVYLTNKWGKIPGGKLTTQVGVLDTDDPYQENSSSPVAGAYVKYDTKILDKDVMLGVGGVYGINSTSLLGTKNSGDNAIYATTVAMTVTLTEWLSLKGEGFAGAKLDDLQGNNTIGVTDTTALKSKSLRSKGGFAEVCLKPTKKLETNYGVGVDLANGDQPVLAASKATVWKSNRTFYTNAKYSLSKDVLVGVEYQYLGTNYMDGVKGEENRIQTSLIYKF